MSAAISATSCLALARSSRNCRSPAPTKARRNASGSRIPALQDPPTGLEAEWLDDRRPIVSRSPHVEDLRVRVEHERDWFGIVGDVKYEDGRIELAILLDAARRQQRFVRIDEQRWVALS